MNQPTPAMHESPGADASATQATPGKGLKVWHLALTLVAVALVLRVGLGALPAPDASTADNTAAPDRGNNPHAQHADASTSNPTPEPSDADLPTAELLPFNLKGEVPGPLLTSILQRYLPNSTPDHANALRDTLPPGQDPRMIVIIPDEEDDVAAMF